MGFLSASATRRGRAPRPGTPETASRSGPRGPRRRGARATRRASSPPPGAIGAPSGARSARLSFLRFFAGVGEAPGVRSGGGGGTRAGRGGGCVARRRTADARSGPRAEAPSRASRAASGAGAREGKWTSGRITPRGPPIAAGDARRAVRGSAGDEGGGLDEDSLLNDASTSARSAGGHNAIPARGAKFSAGTSSISAPPPRRLRNR